MSGDPVSSIPDQVLSVLVECALFDWISGKIHLCGVQLGGSVLVDTSRLKHRCLFVVSVYAPTDCSSSGTRDDFYHELPRLLQSVRSADVFVAVDFNAQPC